MKTNSQKWRTDFTIPAACPAEIGNWKLEIQNSAAFTLIELLVVISIMGILAAFLLSAMGPIKKQRYLKNAQAELNQIEVALDNYKAKYGVYPPGNQNAANLYTASVPPQDRSQFSQLYYELSGTTNVIIGGVTNFVILGGNAQNPNDRIAAADVLSAYGVSGFVNCSKGGGEDAVLAKNFLPGLSSKQIAYYVTNPPPVSTAALITSVGGPDVNYQPLKAPDVNPIRYVYPGVHNPNSYDLWIQLSIGTTFNGPNIYTPNGATNKYLVCNWSKSFPKNSPEP